MPGLGGGSLVSGSSSSALVPGSGGDSRLAELEKVLKAKGPVPELGEEEPQANEQVSVSVEVEVISLVPGLGSDGRLAELGKARKANEPIHELGEEEPQASEHVMASAEEETNSPVPIRFLRLWCLG